MSLLVVGTIALDSVETPERRADEVLGGSATYFSLAASLLSPVRLVGVVGKDFPAKHMELLRSRPIDTSGVVVADGRTFRWSGRYLADLNTRETTDLKLNVIADFKPVLSPAFRS